MSDAVAVQRVSLWREAFCAFRRHWPVWQKLALVFCVLQIPMNYASLSGGSYLANPEFYSTFIATIKNAKELAKAKKRGEDLTPYRQQSRLLSEKTKAITSSDLNFGTRMAAAVGTIILSLVEIYMFCGFFMKRDGVVPELKQDWKGFFYFLLKAIQWWLLIVGFFILTAIIFALGAAAAGIAVAILEKVLHLSSQDDDILSAVLAILGLVGVFCAFVYIGMRYALVFPLAASREQAPLKSSARITQGNIMRLFGNFILLLLILIPVMVAMISLFVDFGVYQANMSVTILITFVYAALNLGAAGLLAAFRSTACRVFIEEKRRADPAFSLTFSSPKTA